MKTTQQAAPKAIKRIVLALAGAGLASLPYVATANPTGGKVVAGEVTINQETATKLGITQTSDKAIIDWQKYSIGANEHVHYTQPSAASISLNRVVGQDPSQILGRLSANGQVFLVNPNGIFFGKNAQIDVAGLVASTHNIRNEDFLAGRYLFNIPGQPGAAVINEGTINIADTGIAAFVAPSVANHGVIVAKLGKVALAAANGFTLDFHGDELLSFLVSDDVAKTAFDIDGQPLTSFVDNSGRIEAQGGYVLLTAKAAETAIHGVINQSGVIEATTVGQHQGEIILNAGKGSLRVAGALDASASNGGDGGFVETSGADVRIADNTYVTTVAPSGKTGTWLIDPNDYTIAAAGGNISGSALSANLANTSVTISTATQGTAGGNGDIFVNDWVNWLSGNSLTLNAERHINVNAAIGSADGNLVLRSDVNGTGIGTVTFGNNGTIVHGSGRVDIYYNPFSYTDGPTKSDSLTNPYSERVLGAANYTAWMLVNNVDKLQAMSTNLRGNYALGKDIDATATSSWNNGAGFLPIGDDNSRTFKGRFAGLGHTISNMFIYRPQTSNIGLFGVTETGAEIRDVGLLNSQFSGRHAVGALVGASNGGIHNSFASGGVVSGNIFVGGLVGHLQYGSIDNSYAALDVTGTDNTGGLVGKIYNGAVLNSYAASSVAGATWTGGLVGHNEYSTVSSSYYDTQTSGQTTGGTGKTTAQMQQQATYAGWDFVNTWRIVEGSSYPLLRVLTQGKITLDVTAGNAQKVYDGIAVNTLADLQALGFKISAGNTLANGDTLPGIDVAASGIWSGTLKIDGAGNTWQGAKNADQYTIRPSGLSSQKYEIVYKDGTLTIQPRPVDITVSKTYDGTKLFNSGFEVGNRVGNDVVNIMGFALVPSVNAGSYNSFLANSLAVSNSNYTVDGAAVLANIQPRPVDVTVSKTYDKTNIFNTGFEVDATRNASGGVLPGDTVKISGFVTTTSADAGHYDSLANVILNKKGLVAILLQIDNKNYVIGSESVVSALIEPAPVYVWANDMLLERGSSVGEFSYRVIGSGDRANILEDQSIVKSIRYSGPSGIQQEVGAFPIGVTYLTLDDNHFAIKTLGGTALVSPTTTDIRRAAYRMGPVTQDDLRYKLNQNLPTFEEAVTPGSRWVLQPPDLSKFHDNHVGRPEYKFVHPDGREVVFDGDSKIIISEYPLWGTYNFSNCSVCISHLFVDVAWSPEVIELFFGGRSNIDLQQPSPANPPAQSGSSPNSFGGPEVPIVPIQRLSTNPNLDRYAGVAGMNIFTSYYAIALGAANENLKVLHAALVDARKNELAGFIASFDAEGQYSNPLTSASQQDPNALINTINSLSEELPHRNINLIKQFTDDIDSVFEVGELYRVGKSLYELVGISQSAYSYTISTVKTFKGKLADFDKSLVSSLNEITSEFGSLFGEDLERESIRILKSHNFSSVLASEIWSKLKNISLADTAKAYDEVNALKDAYNLTASMVMFQEDAKSYAEFLNIGEVRDVEKMAVQEYLLSKLGDTALGQKQYTIIKKDGLFSDSYSLSISNQ